MLCKEIEKKIWIKRINVLEALEHPYVADFHEQYADTEIACEKPIQISIEDNAKYSIKEYKQKLYDDILKRKKEVRTQMIKEKKKKNNLKKGK